MACSVLICRLLCVFFPTGSRLILACFALAFCLRLACLLLAFCWLFTCSLLARCLLFACCLLARCLVLLDSCLLFARVLSCLLLAFYPQDVSKMSSKWLQNSLKKASRGGPGAAPGGSREAPGGVRGRPGGVREAFRRDAGPRAGSGRLPEGVWGRFGSQVGPPLGPSRGSPGCLFQV